MNEIEIVERLTVVEQSTKSAHRRIDTMEKTQNDIQALALSVNDLANTMKHLCEQMCTMQQRVKDIEDKPSKNWENLIRIIITALTTGLIGVIIGYVSKL